MDLFSSIAVNEEDNRAAARKALVLAKTRVAMRFGDFLRQDMSRIAFVQDEIETTIRQAAEEVGYTGDISIADVLETATSHTASVHEARKTKMCPYHRETMDISLASGDPQAGPSAMSSHWGGPRHCQGDGYEGGGCNFKAPMLTQDYWDDKETARKERAEQREQVQQEAQPQAEVGEDLHDEEAVGEPEGLDTAEPQAEAEVVEVDFGSQEPSAVGEGAAETAEIPMSMAASTRFLASTPRPVTAGPGFNNYDFDDPSQGDYQNLMQQPPDPHANLSPEGGGSLSPQQRQQLQRMLGDLGITPEQAAHELAQAGPVDTGAPAPAQAPPGGQPMPPPPANLAHTATETTGLGDVSGPKIDKGRWSNPAPLKLDEANGPHPTKRVDPIERVTVDNSEKLQEIGEQVTEHQDVTKNTAPSVPTSGGSFGGGERSAVSSFTGSPVSESHG